MDLQVTCLKKKTDEIFKELQNVFGIEDDILVVRYDKDATDHNTVLHTVHQTCRNLKCNKDKCHF